MDAFEKLKTWVVDNGGTVSESLNVDKNDNVVCDEPLKTGDELVVLNDRLVIKQEDIDGWDCEDLTSEIKLAVTLLLEDAKVDSFYRPYLDTLPRDYNEHPLNIY